jgi:iron complex outermembrane receptor protein
MKIFAKKRAARTSSGSLAFQLSPVAAGCAVFIAVLGGNVYAQEAAVAQPAATTEPAATAQDAAVLPQVVRVTGIRQGIEAAISIKKNSSSIVEAISQEDIGKLPDSSVAESISRLPGVSTQRGRSSGKSSDISVRGMSPSFNGTLLNGREMASTGNARSPEFDLFPAELMGSIVIYKTPDATVVGQGLASTIDLRTVQPLDFGKRTVAVNYKKSILGAKQRDNLPEGDGDRFSLSYVDQFANRTIGVAVGLTRYEETGGAQSKFNSWGGWAADFPLPTATNPDATVKTPGGFGFDTEVASHNRDGAFASLQFRPNKNFKSTVDLFYSAGETGLKKTGIEAAVGGNSAGHLTYDPKGVLTNATIVNGVATSGTISNWVGVVRNHYEGSKDDLKSIGWNNQLVVGDWTTAADLTWSKASKLINRYETYAGLPGNAAKDSISYTGFDGANFTEVRYTPGMSYADRAVARLTDPMGWSAVNGVVSPQAGYIALPQIDDEVKAVRLNAKKAVEWGPLVATTYGFNYTARDKSRSGDEGRLMIKGGDPFGAATMPGTATTMAGNSGIMVASWDPRGSLGSIYELANKVDADIYNKFWDVKERVATTYFMGELDGELFGLSYRGNVGLQAIHTEQTGGGYNIDRSRCVGSTAQSCPAMRVTQTDKYWDVLPSANVSFDLKNDQLLRFGLAKVVSRANLDDLRAGQNFSLASSGPFQILSGSGGNPELKPFRAKAFDVSYEKYFGKKGYVSVAGFYKKLDSYIYRAPRAYDFGPYVTPTTPLPASGPFAGSTMGLMTQPMNGDGGNLYGFELAVNVPFSMFTSYLDGFGVMVNHSDTRSGIDLPEIGFDNVAGDMVRIPLPGLSRKVSNLRLYYEAHGFQFAAAARKRSNFLGQVSDYQDNQQLTFIKGETIVDLQASYEFQSGWLKGLGVFAQANNMNNAPFLEYTMDPSKPTNRVDYGRTYHFGVNYKF